MAQLLHPHHAPVGLVVLGQMLTPRWLWGRGSYMVQNKGAQDCYSRYSGELCPFRTDYETGRPKLTSHR